MFPSHITIDDLRSWLYPYGRLRTSLACQGHGNRRDWNAFAREREGEQENVEAAPASGSTFYTTVTSPLGSY